ncbi:MAG TPA: DUF58 domain-containing protein, partial [Mycobacteriales bacterium]|nr:DUF58 domain-containing protein [Mycobacteriales bacterium]
MSRGQGLQEAFRGLTPRGRGLLFAGGALAAFSFIAGLPDLETVGVLLVLLPLAAAFTVSRTRYRIACRRSVSPPRVPAGDDARVTLTLENVSRLPTAMLLAEETLPPALGPSPRFTLARVEASGVRTAVYDVTSPVRGRFSVGPVELRLADPFGLCIVRRAFTSTDALIVTPTVYDLPPVLTSGTWTTGGESSTRTLASVGDEDVATRPYRHGDDLRRVHWRSTARTGEIMVRREEQPFQSSVTVLLDSRASAHRGEGLHSSFEFAVSAAASVSVHLLARGDKLRALTDTGASLTVGPPELCREVLLESLAVITPSRSAGLRSALAGLGPRGEGLLVAVCGTLDDDDVAALARARGSGPGVAILLDTASWSDRRAGAGADREAAQQVTRAAELLRIAGWRVAVASRGARL